MHSVHIALLRAVNVGGSKPIAMAELRSLLAELGFEQARSLLQSGNLVFKSKERTDIDLEGLLEKEAAQRLDLHTDFFVRTREAWKRIIANNPFPDEAQGNPAHLVVMFLKSAPTDDAVDALRASIKGRETIQPDGRHLYIVYPDGIGRSKLTGTSIEKKLATRGTARNWNTVLKLEAA